MCNTVSRCTSDINTYNVLNYAVLPKQTNVTLHMLSLQIEVGASHTKRVCGTKLLQTIVINPRLRSHIDSPVDTCEGYHVPDSRSLCVRVT